MSKLTPPPWLEIAEAELGVHEEPGPKSALKILEYHRSTALKATDDNIPWCASFVGWVLKKSGINGTNSAVARSYLNWGKPLNKPEFGCIVILSRGNGWTGHVGFYVGSTKSETIRVLGGNQHDQVSIENFPKSQIIGLRWPKEV